MNAAELPFGETSDPMMQELRKIRTDIQEVLEPLSGEERQAWIHDQAEKGLLKHGYKLVPDPNRPSAYKFKKPKKSVP